MGTADSPWIHRLLNFIEPMRRFTMLVLCVAGLLCFTSSCLRWSWSYRSRLNLLVKGCIFCEVRPLPQSGRVPLGHPNTFVTAVVYKDGVYVGYLDGYGAFCLPGESGYSIAQREMKTIVALWILQWSSGAVFFALLVWISIRRFREKNESRRIAVSLHF